MDIFDWRTKKLGDEEGPLAARMRPRTLDEYVGQQHILGQGRLLRRAILADQLSSVIFYGPPGTGKTTLARIIANTTEAHFKAINAVLAGVKDIREAIDEANTRRGQHGQRTILFVDEVHRFNKSQQDALLPWVESGLFILIGATTENPYFEVNKALVSRSRIFRLVSLEPEDLRLCLKHALEDPERGFGTRDVRISESAAEHLVNVANGDARALLNAIELAVETTPPQPDGQILIDLSVAEESIQTRAVLYDKEGDAHFDTISAFIKSVRGSDPDASLYWLARMVYAGEDPRFIFRRLLILASEDVGLADPNALSVVLSCAQTFDRIGMPEGRYPLAQATLYLATAAKSNTTMAFFDAVATVGKEREGDVPDPLKDPSRDGPAMGHGQNYLYPHAYRDHWVAQQYLPTALQGRLFYNPSDQGYEATIKAQVERRRDAQLEAMLDSASLTPVETFSHGNDKDLERWLQRANSGASQWLSRAREEIFGAAGCARHHVVLVLGPRSGLLTFEALRQVPEGGVMVGVSSLDLCKRLEGQCSQLPALSRPQVFCGEPEALVERLEASAPGIRFDRIVAQNLFASARGGAQRAAWARLCCGLLAADGVFVSLESIPREAQRIWKLVAAEGAIDPALAEAWGTAEETLYDDADDPLLNWDASDLVGELGEAGLSVRSAVKEEATPMWIAEARLEQWFSDEASSYKSRLAASLDEDTLERLESATRRAVRGRAVSWVQRGVLLTGRLT